MLFTYINCFRSRDGITACLDLIVITQVTHSLLWKMGSNTSASSQMTCQCIRTGHPPTVTAISATELSHLLCERAPQATHKATSVFTLTLHEPQPSPLAEQLYILSSLWHLGCCFLCFPFPSSEQIGCLGSPSCPPMPALLLWKSLPRIPAFLEVALNKLCCVFPPPGFFYSSSCRKK